MGYWNQIAWAFFWGFLCVAIAVPTIGMSFAPTTSDRTVAVGLCLTFLFGFLSCRAFHNRRLRSSRSER